MASHNDTIAAIATAPGTGGVGIIRISGSDAFDIAKKLSHNASFQPRYAHFRHFYHADKQLIDTGLLLFFPNPASFTGEDVVEIQAHGGHVVMHMLLAEVIRLGARMARPGEFSERAFLNNKIDLLQAEAIADLIAGGSEQAVFASQRSLQGDFSKQVNAILAQLIEIRVWLESAIDFPEEEIDFLADQQLHQQLTELKLSIEKLRQKSRSGVVLNKGISIAIIGAPNVGKSSLLNALTEEDTAITSDIAGTTRDVIKADVLIHGIPVRLVDTAGIRESDNPIEQQGIEKARAIQASCDVILTVYDGSEKISEIVKTDESELSVINKIDQLHPDNERLSPDLWLSAKTGDGIESLKQRIVDSVKGGDINENSFTARQRHIEQLNMTQQHVNYAEQHLKNYVGELAAEELRLAQNSLNAITGEFTSDDLLGEIFSSFCIGK
ncbi:tRNA uridine-5-carboxymethylaminomethyl(34) synthesis GTPase MnmE [Marinicella gelatinilytica]|uniref:tRNA uridine-5-carboxymethylaminomethyl(34) synthesis GTPase MnmE n=1 Tax=Marinicella gelatinilytica TaxID=2996017 RepID=UPI002260B440|nr:tRNA uridine-5-carboxymethylaminomethyl(34) synthesis GTPase MnmE [Marinicella gelatinilytica]MCX7545390.1 tRNA uridine-5-carboxymethylaminomethyl(34) synthesis GTPase MnmE [Marinicella gelatinilytica]